MESGVGSGRGNGPDQVAVIYLVKIVLSSSSFPSSNMSDQQEPPPKKVGSLRDRIAAFEKAGAGSAGPAPAPPAPRPKPAGFSTWKPRQPSPPPAESSESSQTGASKPSAGLSAADAKESIVKGGSLKERMAALQGKGAFGAPPALAPKPPLEKPKWKPPPVIPAPVDEDESADGEKPRPERKLSDLIKTAVPASSEGGEERSGEGETDVAPKAAEEGEEGAGEPDPEEEERQRRAAIAARMARLGGARVGMAPPVFGKRPPPPPKKRSSIDESAPAKEPPTSPKPEPTEGTSEAKGKSWP